ncbi:hypothetical protein GSI_04184 [Ganoderma sinense ZZ0214-1]|uniref:Eukaryotic translation initiation factor 4G1 eIF4E-binding domain-containing protein n=1 Tax=Ganoderma sinense ZZ0214-1 TaxID=1077348 RepID=A0A2G8SIH6_9APHY|nr:hypothetical protein GSI_04184 [Ganoderma sinense ZZ0214-1]
MPDPYGYSPPSPWWSGKSYGTSGGVKLSLVTDQRSEKPSFWEPRPINPPASASPSVTALPPFSPSTSVASPTTPGNTHSLESVRQVLASRDQRAQQHASGGDTDSQSVASSKDQTPYYTRQWRDRDDTQSTPGTPSSADQGTHHPHAQTYVEWRAQRRGRGRGRGRGQGQGRGGWYYNQEPDAGHMAYLDARAQEFVPGQMGPQAEAGAPPSGTTGEIDLNEYIRAGSVAETIGSSRVSVFGSRSRSRSRTPSEVEDDRDVRCTERERAEAERQWHLQTSWDDEEKAADEWTGDAQGVVQEQGEVREGIVGGEVPAKSEWEGGVVHAPIEVSVPVPVEVPVPAPVESPPPPRPATANAPQTSLPTLPFGFLLERAKMIQEGDLVVYPENVKPPDAHRNSSAKCYDRDFLLHFQSLCTGRPFSVPYIAPFWHSILAPYELRPAPVRTKEKWVQASLADDTASEYRPGQRHTVSIGVETNQPSIDGDAAATSRIVDVVYNQLVPDSGGRQLSLGGSLSSSGELTCRDTPTRDEHTFEYEVQEAQRERLEARVEFLAAEVKVLRLELARIRKLVG